MLYWDLYLTHLLLLITGGVQSVYCSTSICHKLWLTLFRWPRWCPWAAEEAASPRQGPGSNTCYFRCV